MRRIPRKTLVVSLAAALSVGISATAFGDGAADNTSQISSGLNPTLLPDDGETAKKAGLYTQVTTYDNDNTPTTPAEASEEVYIDFPAEMKYTANSKLAKCNLTDGELTAATTDDVSEDCNTSYIGSGHAFARIPGFPTPNNEVELTVTVFNGPTSTAGGGFTGGFPTVILHADAAAITATPVRGEVRDSPFVNTATEQYGQQLNVPDAPDVAGDVGALVQFGAQTARNYDNGKTGDKKKKYSLITGNCDGSGDGDFDFRATWVYDDDSTDTDTFAQDCTVEP